MNKPNQKKPKLSLNKQTIAKLNDSELKEIIGGGDFTQASTCILCSAACTHTIHTYTGPGNGC